MEMRKRLEGKMYREAIVLCSTQYGTEELRPYSKIGRAKDVNNLPLVISQPQLVNFCDRLYSVKKEGLYRFIDLGWCGKDEKRSGRPYCLKPEKRYVRNLIYFKKDMRSFLQAICRLHIPGAVHQSWSLPRRKKHALRGRLAMSCGRISEFTCELFKEQNIRCRQVAIITLEEWKTTGMGHTLFEYFDRKEKKWILADISMRSLFMKGETYLNLYQLTNAVRYGDDFQIERIVEYPICNIDPSPGIEGKFDASILSDEIKATEASVKKWFQRTAYVPFIQENGKWWFWAKDEKEKERIENYSPSYSYLPENEWFKRFYPGRKTKRKPLK
jgi:hypothetical protein